MVLGCMCSSFEEFDFPPLPLGEKAYKDRGDPPEHHRQTMVQLDLGPSDYSFEPDLGPTSDEEEAYFEDADEPEYIDNRLPRGIHCMDDRISLPGIQLPGGIIENNAISRLMTSRRPGEDIQTIEEIYKSTTEEALKHGFMIWEHGDVCAAMAMRQKALEKTAEHEGAAYDFTHEILLRLRRKFSPEDIYRSIAVGYESSQTKKIWNMGFRRSLEVAREHPEVNYEEFAAPHQLAGLRFDLTGNLFNNAKFRKDHNGFGLLSVTLGAWGDELEKLGFDDRRVTRELTHTTLFTFGLAKTIGHQYLRAGIVVPHQG